MDVILDRGSTPLTSTKGLAQCARPFVFLQEPFVRHLGHCILRFLTHSRNHASLDKPKPSTAETSLLVSIVEAPVYAI